METAGPGSVAWMDTTVNFADADRGIGRVPTLDLFGCYPTVLWPDSELSFYRAVQFVINVDNLVA